VSRAGFSLIEVVVVLGILAIAALMVVPPLRDANDDSPLESSSREVRAVIDGARRLAIRQGRPVSLTLQPATARYWVDVGSGDSAWSDIMVLPSEMRLTSPALYIHYWFPPTGEVHSDGSPVLTGRGFEASIQVNRWSGDVRVEPR
jgi:prepilin-type N-terminal cleavage/methylation domain-containing protein